MALSDTPTDSNGSAEHRTTRRPPSLYRKRNRAYTGLLLFVVIVGLPIVGVPYLRNRLSARVLMLKAAMNGEIRPVVAQVGANKEPFPAEYERPEPSVPQAFKLPPADKVYTLTPEGHAPPPSISRRAVTQKPKSEILPEPAEGEEIPGNTETAQEAAKEAGPEYKQGENEQKAYDLLLKSNPTVAGMVQGSNSSLHFDSWGAAYRGDDVYWVRLKFNSENDQDMEYIWQVNLGSSEITALSYYARSIS